jgi:hypothetical protein
VASIAHGGFLIVDAHNHTVRKVSASGIISQIAGTGTPGSRSEDGPALTAHLSEPVQATPTADGGSLLVDRGSRTVHKVESTG